MKINQTINWIAQWASYFHEHTVSREIFFKTLIKPNACKISIEGTKIDTFLNRIATESLTNKVEDLTLYLFFL